MHQTLFALAALLAFAIYGLSRHQNIASDESMAIVVELERAALRVAQEQSARVKNSAFDEADIGRADLRLPGDFAGLTLPSQFGRTLATELDEIDADAFDDIDDYDGLRLRVNAPVGDGTVPFIVTFDVDYVDALSGDVLATPRSTTKRVVVVVAEENPLPGRPAVRVELQGLYNPVKLALHN